MFLFEQPFEYFEEPWPHIVIENVLPLDAAEHMLNNWPVCMPYREKGEVYPLKGLPEFGAKYGDPVFDEFERVNYVERTEEILKLSAKIFQDKHWDDCDLDGLFYKEAKKDYPVLLRDWHIDALSKKYHGILYIGSGPQGEFMMWNKQTDEKKAYEYTHNRFIYWRNTADTFHKFYSSTPSRKTISISADFKGYYS